MDKPGNESATKQQMSGGSAYSPLKSRSNFSDQPSTEMALLFPVCD
jgi:hypothetical protein